MHWGMEQGAPPGIAAQQWHHSMKLLTDTLQSAQLTPWFFLPSSLLLFNV